MHATPESFRPNQSPLAADLPCARHPYETARCRSNGPASGRKDLSAAESLPVGSISTSRSRTRYGPLRMGHADPAPRVLGVHQPLTVQAGQSPPDHRLVRASVSQAWQPFIRRILVAIILLASPDRRGATRVTREGTAVGQVSRRPLSLRWNSTSRPAAVAGNPRCPMKKSISEYANYEQ